MQAKWWSDLRIDKIASRTAALGVPGLILALEMTSSGLAGAAALVGALTDLGGRFGFSGGIAMLGALGAVSYAVVDHFIEAVFTKMVTTLFSTGTEREQIKAMIDRCPVTPGLKRALRQHLSQLS